MQKEPLKDYEDWLNTKRTRNCDNTNQFDYNCGGYCLNTFSWYHPYEETYLEEEFDSLYDWVNYHFSKRENCVDEMYTILLEVAKDQILNDFKGTVRLIIDPTDVKDDEKLVVYKVGFSISHESDDSVAWSIDDIDFHFKQYDGNCWSDKPGCNEVRYDEVSSIEEVVYNFWDEPSLEDGYDSDPLLFAVKKM